MRCSDKLLLHRQLGSKLGIGEDLCTTVPEVHDNPQSSATRRAEKDNMFHVITESYAPRYTPTTMIVLNSSAQLPIRMPTVMFKTSIGSGSYTMRVVVQFLQSGGKR